MSGAGPLRVAVVGATGRLGGSACALLRSTEGFELVAAWSSADPWLERAGACGARVALEATRAGLGFEHAKALLERGLRPVVATSGVTPEESAELDRLARSLDLGGIVVPNFSLGALLLQRAAEQIARLLPAAEIVELHHQEKRDAPSGTALETARRIAAARGAGEPRASPEAGGPARGDRREGIPIHSVRLPGMYAHQEVVFGSRGETLALRHDMSGPEAFGPGILRALRYASTALGVARGLEAALPA